MRHIKAAILMIRSSGSLAIGGIYLLNMAMMAAGVRFRVRRFKTTKFRIDGVSYFANSWDGLLALRPHHEPAVRHLVSMIAAQSAGRGIFVNCGAHIGRYTLEFARFFDRTYSIEPTPTTYALLRSGVDVHPDGSRIETYQVCLGDSDSRAILSLMDDESQNSIANRQQSAGRSISVPMRRLDSLIPEADVDKIALILIDAEGSETQVLRGAKNVLARGNPQVIVELLGGEAERSCTQMLHAMGYTAEALDGRNWIFKKNR